MAWLEQRGKLFHLVFRIGGRKVKKSLKTANSNDACERPASHHGENLVGNKGSSSTRASTH